MINNKQVNIKNSIADAIDNYLEYADGYKLRLIINQFNLCLDNNDKYDYVAMLDSIKNACLLDLSNSIVILNFIYNDYKVMPYDNF